MWSVGTYNGSIATDRSESFSSGVDALKAFHTAITNGVNAVTLTCFARNRAVYGSGILREFRYEDFYLVDSRNAAIEAIVFNTIDDHEEFMDEVGSTESPKWSEQTTEKLYHDAANKPPLHGVQLDGKCTIK